ncbi:MAG: amidohydrolase family protein, partial [Actinomycetota bacterium]
LMPPWALEGGPGRLLDRLADPAERERIRADLGRPWGELDNPLLSIGFGRITVVGFTSEENLGFEGMSIADIARRRGREPDECALDLILEEDGEPSVIQHHIDERDMEVALAWPWAMVGSDGLPLKSAKLHPRHYGTFPRVLGRYVRERKTLSLEAAVRKMTSLPADRFRLPGRGRVVAGAVADLVVFTPDEVEDAATFDDPRRHPKGIDMVVVNGRVAARDGACENHPGTLVRARDQA